MMPIMLPWVPMAMADGKQLGISVCMPSAPMHVPYACSIRREDCGFEPPGSGTASAPRPRVRQVRSGVAACWQVWRVRFGFGRVRQAGGCGGFGFGRVRQPAGWRVWRVRARSSAGAARQVRQVGGFLAGAPMGAAIN